MLGRSRSLRCLLTALLMVILTLFSAYSTEAEEEVGSLVVASIPGATYMTGTWYVNDTQNRSNEVIVLSGMLRINNGGELNLRNVTLMMNCTASNGQYGIYVYGKLNVTDGDGDPSTTHDRSNITDSPYDADNLTAGFDYRYTFYVSSSENFVINNSIIRECGYSTSTTSAGLYIYNTDEASLQNNTIENCFMGAYLSYSDGYRIINNTFRNCNNIGINMKNWCDHGVIADNDFIHNDAGMYVYSRRSVIRGNQIIKNSNIYTSPPEYHKHGMALRLEYSEVFNNTLRGNGGYNWCLNLYLTQSNYVRVHHNDIVEHDPISTAYSSAYVAYSKNIMIDNNTISKNKGHGLIIILTSTYNNIHVVDNDFIMNGGRAIYVQGQADASTPYSIIGNQLIDNDDFGIYIHTSRGHQISNNTITSTISGSYGVYASEIDGGDFSNNTLSNQAYDIYAGSSSSSLTRFEVTNCDFGTVALGSWIYDPRIIVYNYLQVNVTDDNGAVPFSDIEVRDIGNELAYSGLTNGYGKAPFIKLEHGTVYYDSAVMSWSSEGPYNISCTSDGTTSYGDEDPYMNQTTWVDITFDLDLPPDPPRNLIAFSHNEDINLSWEASSSSDIDHYLIYRNDSSGDWVLRYNTTTNAATKLDTAYVDVDAASDWYPYTYMVKGVDAKYQRSIPSNNATCGDWVVSSTLTVADTALILHGDLIITSTGELTLNNVKIRFNCSEDGEYGLLAMEGSTLVISDGDDDPSTPVDRSEISSLNEENSIFFIVGSTSFVLENSALMDCGYYRWGMDWDTYQSSLIVFDKNKVLMGPYLSGDEAEVVNNTFFNCYISLFLEGCENSTVADNTFSNETFGIYSAYGKYNDLNRNYMKNTTDIGIFILDESNSTISGNNITNISSPNYGIILYGSRAGWNEVSSNHVTSVERGIFLDEAGSNNDLLKNVISNCEIGIRIEYSFHTSSRGNVLVDNVDYGMYLYNSLYADLSADRVYGSGIGVYLRYSDYANVSDLTILNTVYTGLYVNYCDHVELSN
ncbi:MAG: right-handed parallel beta-helix repeat-containing protein, partial [Thermoplasmata archaeon]|nr:right-handed parallel beta-helix repeat-containing protein [Thermoplasmata archaeon]